jgi:hypothetical protein
MVIASAPNDTRTGAMTPAETALYLGVPNLVLRIPPKSPRDHHQFALSLSPLKQVVWPIDREGDIPDVLRLMARFPGFTGVLALTPALAGRVGEPFGHARVWMDAETKPTVEQAQFASVVVFQPANDSALSKLEKLAPAADKLLVCPLWDEAHQKPISLPKIRNLCGAAATGSGGGLIRPAATIQLPIKTRGRSQITASRKLPG